MADRDRAVVGAERGDRHRRAHARRRGVVERTLVHAPVRLLDQLHDLRPRRLPRGRCARAAGRLRARRRARRPARPPCRPRPRRAAGRRRRVLVAAALAARVGLAVALADRDPGSLVSLLEPQVGLADADDVAGREAPLAREADPVDERAVGRAGVLDVDTVAARLEARVPRRGVLVAVDRDVVRAAAADAQRRASRSRRPRPPAGPGSRRRRCGRARSPTGWGSSCAACWGERIIDSCGSRRSRAAERTMRQMKR